MCHLVKLLNQYSNNPMDKNKPCVTARFNLFRDIFLNPIKVAMNPRLQIFWFDHLKESLSYKLISFIWKVLPASVKSSRSPVGNINETPPFVNLQRILLLINWTTVCCSKRQFSYLVVELNIKTGVSTYDEGAPDDLDNTFRPVVSILWIIRWSKTILRLARSKMSSSILPLATSR